jgi:hypothetical protein
MRGTDAGRAPRAALAGPLLAALALAGAGAADAHGVHDHEGRVRIAGARVITTVADGAENARSWLERLVVRDDRGRRLAGSAEPAAGADRCELTHEAPEDARWIVVQLAPGDAPASRAERLALRVDEPGSEAPRVLALTSGGNVEVLPLARWRPRGLSLSCEGTAAPGELLERVEARVARTRDAARVVVVMPLGIARSFGALPAAGADALSVEDQARIASALADVVRARVTLRSGADAVLPERPSGWLLDLDERAVGEPAPGPRALAALTARVAVAFDARLPAGADATLEWGMFNALVHRGTVSVTRDGTCEERVVTARDPSAGL